MVSESNSGKQANQITLLIFRQKMLTGDKKESTLNIQNLQINRQIEFCLLLTSTSDVTYHTSSLMPRPTAVVSCLRLFRPTAMGRIKVKIRCYFTV